MHPADSRTVRARSAALLAAAALTAMLALPGTAAAQNRSCSDFGTQEDAQAVLDQDRNDPGNLDSNRNGVACETLPHREAGVTTDPGAPALAAVNPDPTTAEVTTTPEAAALVDAGTTAATTTDATTTAATTTAPCTTTVTVTATATTTTTAPTTSTTAPTTSTTAPATTTSTDSCSTGTDGSSDGSGDGDSDGDSDGGSDGGGGSSSDDRDCDDFSSQSDAQSALDADKDDPDKLDADDDGIACEDRFGTPGSQVQVVPSGGVDTGGDPVDA